MCLKMILTISVFITVYVTFGNGALTGPAHDQVVVCYVGTWAAYRPAAGKFELESLEPELCTHVVYSFAGLNEQTNTIKSLDPWQDLEKDYGKAGYKRLVALKKDYPHLKVTLAIGGWNEGSAKYSAMASTSETRAVFIQSVMFFLDTYKFDGLDLDWEYPGLRGGQPQDKQNFPLLVKELKDAFESKGYLLTAALGAGRNTMETAYDLAKLSRYLDFIHIMAYDYHGTWDGVLGANAPLRGSSPNDELSIEFTTKYLLSQGVSPYKLVLGLPLYGRTFLLKDPATKVIQFGSTPVQSQGFKGLYTKEAGFMGYNEICEELKVNTSSWTTYWHESTATPYARHKEGQKVISYDNGRSLAMKVKTAIDQGFGGVMVWSIDTDDFSGLCDHEVDPYIDFVERHKEIVNDPLLKKALKELHLPSAKHISLKKNAAYVMDGGTLQLRLPIPVYNNYGLMQTINAAISLASEENVILRAMDKISRENEIGTSEKTGDKGSGTHISSSLLTVLFSVFISYLKYF